MKIIPDGWKLVPEKATPAMLKAGALARHSGACDGQWSYVGWSAAEAAYREMLNAAPTATDSTAQKDY
jgi:hypothetical protein